MRWLRAALTVAVSVIVGCNAAAAQTAQIEIELNKLEEQQDDCRANLIVQNKTDSRFESLKLDLVMFDIDGIVAKRLAVEAAPLPAGKTSLKVFDIADLPCPQIGRMLLNDVMDCADGAGSRDDCVALVATSARGDVAFIK